MSTSLVNGLAAENRAGSLSVQRMPEGSCEQREGIETPDDRQPDRWGSRMLTERTYEFIEALRRGDDEEDSRIRRLGDRTPVGPGREPGDIGIELRLDLGVRLGGAVEFPGNGQLPDSCLVL